LRVYGGGPVRCGAGLRRCASERVACGAVPTVDDTLRAHNGLEPATRSSCCVPQFYKTACLYRLCALLCAQQLPAQPSHAPRHVFRPPPRHPLVPPRFPTPARHNGTAGVVLEPMPWQQLVSLIADGSPRALGRLGRHPLGIKRYWDHRDKVLLQRYASGAGPGQARASWLRSVPRQLVWSQAGIADCSDRHARNRCCLPGGLQAGVWVREAAVLSHHGSERSKAASLVRHRISSLSIAAWYCLHDTLH
jgi:hypothetical protein